MRKLIFVLPTLGIGGGERVVTNIANHLDRSKYEVKILLIRDTRHSYVSSLKSDIQVYSLSFKGKMRFALIPLLKVLIKEKPQVVFMGMGDLNLMLSPFIYFFRSYKWIARETNTVSKKVKSPILRFFYKLFYSNYDLIIAQCKGMKDDLVNQSKIAEEKIMVINNPLDTTAIKNKLEASSHYAFNEKVVNIVACGRLTYQKGFDLLLKEFSKIRNIENFHLTIVGAGYMDDVENQEGLLMRLTSELGIQRYITFAGYQPNVYSILKKADYFILSSRYEGFPNVVLESLYCGIPVLANNYADDIQDMIKDGINGYIFSFEQSNLSEVLDKAQKTHWDENVIRASVREFEIEYVIKEYNCIL